MTRPMAERGRSVRALDVSAEMLGQAQAENAALDNVEWLHGDGTTLTGVADASADGCLSYVVLQHIPDPEVTLGYIREMGRVLRPGGWAAFQVSNDPTVHRPRGPRGLRQRLRVALGRAPARPGARRLARLRRSASSRSAAAAADGGMEIERTSGEGSQFCLVLTRKRPA